MRVLVEFEKKWSVAEIEDYIRNPNAEKYVDMPDDMYIELVACAEGYAEGADEEDMNNMAAESIASGIEDYFFADMFENYYDYYATQTALHLDDERKQHYAKELRLSIN